MLSLKISIKHIGAEEVIVINDNLIINICDIDFIEMYANTILKIQNSVCIHTKDDHNWIFINENANSFREFLLNANLKNVKIK